MADRLSFIEQIKKGYDFKGAGFKLGTAMLGGEVIKGTGVILPLRTLNRHGLIAGATGTGKTKSLQVIAEGLSEAGVPVLLMDIKGDLSGIARPGAENDKIRERLNLTGDPFQPAGFPVELMSLSHEKGIRLRSTVSEFGPILLSRILGLNDTQEGVVSLIFKYCDDQRMPLLDLKDFMKVLQYLGGDGKKELESVYGKIPGTTTGTILRKVVELQQQEADLFFGEPSFEINDLMRNDPQGKGVVSILRVGDMQNRPKLFSTFMLGLLAELYATLPEAGDLEKPKLVMCIDEAHLVFQEATDALLKQIETVVKLIRSKGVGILFCTQNPVDIPASVLSQLGLKVQHALRAFTARDRKSIRQAAENYPETDFYKVEDLITHLGIGEALITALDEKGIPTPLVQTFMVVPRSRMDVLSESEMEAEVSKSGLYKKYAIAADSKSAYEILTDKMEEAARRSEEATTEKNTKSGGKSSREESIFDNTVVRQAGRTAASIITRSLLGALGLGGTSRKKKNTWF